MGAFHTLAEGNNKCAASEGPGRQGHLYPGLPPWAMRFGHRFRRCGVILRAIEFGVNSVPGHQFVVVPDSLTTPPAITMIWSASRMVAKPVGDGDDGASLHQPLEGFNDQLLGFAIEGGGGFVEQQNGAVADHDAGDADALALAAGEGRVRARRPWCRSLSAFCEMNSSALASLAAATISSRVASGRPKAMFSRIGAAEEHGVLQDVADLLAQRISVLVAHSPGRRS